MTGVRPTHGQVGGLSITREVLENIPDGEAAFVPFPPSAEFTITPTSEELPDYVKPRKRTRRWWTG